MRVIVCKWVHLVVKREKNKEREEERKVARVTVSGGCHCVWLYSGLSQAEAGSWIAPVTAYIHWQSVCLIDSFEFHIYKLCPASSGRHPRNEGRLVILFSWGSACYAEVPPLLIGPLRVMTSLLHWCPKKVEMSSKSTLSAFKNTRKPSQSFKQACSHACM